MEKAREECFVGYITVSVITVKDVESAICGGSSENLPEERFALPSFDSDM